MMKSLFALLIFSNGLWATPTEPVALKVSAPAGWRYVPVSKGSAAANLGGGANGFLTFGGTLRDGPDITVSLHEFPLGKIAKPGSDAARWHNFMFDSPASAKLTIASEGTMLVKGQWRYYIEYKTENGSTLNTAVIAWAQGGIVHALIYETPREVFRDQIRDVKTMFHAVDISR